MALYSYQAFTKDGKRTTGTVDAPSLASAREQLVRMSLYPVKIEATPEGIRQGFSFRSLFTRGVSAKEKILFTKQLAVLLKSGVPLLEAFELLIDQFEGRMRSILISIKDGLREGQSFAEGLSKYPKVFENIYVQLVRAGEASGKLEVILDRLVDFLERREEIRRRIKSALRYPMIQLGAVGMVVIFLMTVVVPMMAENFKQSKKALPASTQIMLNISYAIRHYWIFILAGILLLVAAYQYWRRTPAGGLFVDKLKLKIPILKFFTRTGAVVQFSRTLGMLIESGVNLAESLDIVVNIIDNKVLSSSLREARENIIKQGKIAQFLKQTGLFPPIAIHLIKTGEESGKLDFMLLTVAQNYETELNEYAEGLSSALEPITLLVMAVVVGLIVLSIAQPLMEQMQLAVG
jgi:type II secretory pathway component PulF